MLRSRVEISQADYQMLHNAPFDKLKEFAYWAAKFRTGWPAEGYGIFGPHVEEKDGKYAIVWEHLESAD